MLRKWLNCEFFREHVLQQDSCVEPYPMGFQTIDEHLTKSFVLLFGYPKQPHPLHRLRARLRWAY